MRVRVRVRVRVRLRLRVRLRVRVRVGRRASPRTLKEWCRLELKNPG